jgi:SAM-dependent methyltransferase
MPKKDFHKLSCQLELPFLETKQIHFITIFRALKEQFGLKNDSKQLFIDLGSGNGQVIIYSAINYGIRSVGIEIDPILIKEAKNSIEDLKKYQKFRKSQFKKIRIIRGNFYQQNLKDFDYIYIYSLPTMQKYLNHVFQTAKCGAIIISHIYPIQKLNQFLELRYKLEHDNVDQKAYTFFYRRF